MGEDAKIADLFDALRVALLDHLLSSVEEAAALKGVAVAVRAAGSERQAALIIRDALIAPLLAKRMESGALRRLNMETLAGRPSSATLLPDPMGYIYDYVTGSYVREIVRSQAD